MEPYRQGPGGGTIFELVYVTSEPVSGPDSAAKAFLYYLKDVGFRVKLFGSDGEPLTEANVSVLLQAQTSNPPPVAGHGQLFSKSTGGVIQFFYISDTGVVSQITPVVTAADLAAAVAVEAAARAAAVTSEANTRIAADALEGQARMDADAGLQSSINALNGLVIHKDGSVPFEANQSMGSHRLTNVTDPASAQDADTKAARDVAIAAALAGAGQLVLVEKKVLVADATDVTFSGLLGNTDLKYVLSIQTPLIPDNVLWSLRLNGDTTDANYSFQLLKVLNNTVTGFPNSPTGPAYFAQTAGGTSSIVVDLQLWAKSGNKRHYICTQPDEAVAMRTWAGHWSNTADEITSLTIHSDVASAIKSGCIITLYKMPNG